MLNPPVDDSPAKLDRAKLEAEAATREYFLGRALVGCGYAVALLLCFLVGWSARLAYAWYLEARENAEADRSRRQDYQAWLASRVPKIRLADPVLEGAAEASSGNG